MESEDHEELEEEMELPQSYDSPPNSASPRMPSPVRVEAPLSMAARKATYRECLKNHAVGIGGHAVDGCGEFISAGADGTLDGLMCAACNCHRNFHRKEPDAAGYIAGAEALNFRHPLHRQLQLTHQPHHYQLSPNYRTSSGYFLFKPPQGRPLVLPSCAVGGSREDEEDVWNPSSAGGGAKKRSRTKFTAEQKEKMIGLAERLGWRIQKVDEEVVRQFCEETGLQRHVLKVWMHNNKNTLAKKP